MATKIKSQVRTIESDVTNVYVKVITMRVNVLQNIIKAELRCYTSKEKSIENPQWGIDVPNVPPVLVLQDLTPAELAVANHRGLVYKKLESKLTSEGLVVERID